MKTVNEIIEYTNNRINNWYLNAKEDYGVIGKGKAFFDEDSSEIIVYYVENGDKKVWSMFLSNDDMQMNAIEWVFDCWSSLC